MNPQSIVTPTSENGVTLSEAAEDNADRLAVQDFRRKLATGEEELIPSEVVDRLLSHESRIRVWRKHRGMTAKLLADKAGIAQPFLSQIETGKREGTVDTLRSLADALGVMIDDLVG